MLLYTLDRASRGGDGGPRFFIPLVLLVLLGFVIAKIVRRRRGHEQDHHVHGSPIGTLEHRFAIGEIDRDEFEHRKAVLDGSDSVPPAPARSAPVAMNEEPASTPATPTSATDTQGEGLPDPQLGTEE